jgi:hypothetical protein
MELVSCRLSDTRDFEVAAYISGKYVYLSAKLWLKFKVSGKPDFH